MKRAKRKAARKKAIRKVVRKKGHAKRKGQKFFVLLDPSAPLGAKKTRLDRGKGDKICWINNDTQKHSIVFNDDEWPFGGKQKDINVKPGSMKTKKVRKGATKMQYDYDVVPAVKYAAGTPPDGPAVVVGED